MKTRFLGAAVWVSALFFAACSEGGDYTSVIPQEAAVVTSFDFQQLAEKSGLNGEDGKFLIDMASQSLNGELNAQEQDLLNKILENPLESGLDLRKDVYLFATSGGQYGGIVAAVTDAGKVEEMVQVLVDKQLCEPLAEADGCRYTIVDGSMVLAYNETAFLAVTAEGRQHAETLKTQAMAWLKNEKTNSYTATEEFQKMTAAEGDITLAASLDILPEEQAKLFRLNMPVEIDLKDVAGVVAVHFEKGEVRMDIETLYKSDALKEQVKKQEKVYETPLKGVFMDKFPLHSMMYGALSCNGEELYNVLMENEQLKAQLEAGCLPFDLEKLLGALDGEVALSVAEGKMIPQFGLYAEVENEEVLKLLDDYKMPLAFIQARYGVKDGVFYLTNMPEVLSGESLASAPWVSQMKGNYAYMMLDFKVLSDMVKLLGNSSQAHMAGMIAEYLKTFAAYSEDVTHSHLVLTAVDAETNTLKQLVDVAKKMNGIQ